MDDLKDTRGKGRGWRWKIPLGIVLVLLVGLTIAVVNIDAIARYQINKTLALNLVAGGEIADVDIQLIKGRVVLQGLTLHPPPGFGGQPPLSWEALTLDVAPLSLFTGMILVEEIGLEGLAIRVVRDTNGRLNLLQMVPPPKAASATESPADLVAGEPSRMPAVHVKSMVIQKLTLHLFDRVAGEQWSAGLRCDLTLSGLQIDDLTAQEILVDSIDAAVSGIKVNQPPGFSDKPLLAVDKIVMASRGIDLGAGMVSISDLILDSLSMSVERNKIGEVNVLKLKEAWLQEKGRAAGETPQGTASKGEAGSPDFRLPAIVVDKVALTSIRAQLLAAIEGQAWRAGFDGMDIRAAGVELGDPAEQELALASFDLDVKGVAVDQPPGFDGDTLFGFDRLTIVTEKLDMAAGELVVKKVGLEGLTSSVIMSADGVTNLDALSRELIGRQDNTQPPREEAAVIREASPPPDLQPVLLERIVLDGGPVTYRDNRFAGETLTAALDNIKLAIDQLRLFGADTGVDPAAVSLSFELAQPAELPTAYCGTLARVGPVSSGIPMINAQARLVGFKLDTLGSLVPPATRTALGATGLDAHVSLAVDMAAVDLSATGWTDRGIEYKGLRVHGPLNAPVVKPGPLLTGVFSRVSDGLLNVGKSSLKSGVDIVEGGALAVKELGVGTVKVGTNLGKSVMETIAGVVTLDREKVKAGAVATTKGTMDLTGDSIRGTGQAAGSGLKESTADLKGEVRVQAWDAEIPSRYRQAMERAERALAEMPYPPVTN